MHIFEVHYGGEFVHIPEFKYVGGKVAHLDEVDPDLMSYFEVLDCIREISVPIEFQIYYIVPNADLEHGPRLLISDQNVLEMFEMNMGHQIIDIYSGEDVNEAANGNNDGENANGNNNGENLNGNNDGEDANGNNTGEHVNGNNDGLNENYQDEEGELEVDFDFEYFLDGDTLSDGCDPLDEKEIVKKAKEQWGRPPNYVEYEQLIREDFEAYIAEKGKGKIQEKEVVSDDEVLNQALNSSDDEMVDDFPEFNAEREMEKPDLVVGQLFNNVVEFRVALKQHAIVNGFEVKCTKNDNDRVTATCVKNCGWRIHARKFRGSLTFQIKTLDGIPHRCPWSYKNKSANSRWLAQKFIRQIANDPSIRVRNFKQTVKDKFNINVFDNQLCRAKSKAIRTIQGEHKEQYWRLRDYCATILERNPGSCALVVTETHPMYENPIFKRKFVMFNAQKEGFISACRPVIGLDACHLKCTMDGQLMAVVARNANNQMFLLGLIDSIEELFPGVEHRYCIGHIFHEKRLWIAKVNSRICPRIIEKLEDYKFKEQGPKNLNSLEETISSNTTFQNPSSITANQPPSRTFEIGSSSRGRARGRAWGRGAKFVPYCGIGNWNGLGMSNMKSFIRHSQVWTTSSSTTHNSALTSNVNPVGKEVGHEELRAVSVSSIGPAGGRVSAGMSSGRGEVLKIQTRFGVRLLASQSSSNSVKKSVA
ncbi:hypothetical protein ACH5RR_009387 [Cinchona calisaya]|uniref:Transposase MuDR plant domain-containing protein n=1 Tax=Cinchona calisaya TaxID=153742 RepID=A0ABD3AHB4_9GENT